MTCARRRMVRGETQYNKMSRFLKEVPLELISTGNKFSGNGKSLTDHADHEEPEKNGLPDGETGILRRKHLRQLQQRENPLESLRGKAGVWVGDRVRHIKFSEGTVCR